MIEPSQSLQNIFEFSVSTAKDLEHEYITIEHLAYGILCDTESYKLVNNFCAVLNFIKSNLE